MLPKRTIQKFLNRPLVDHEKWKKLTDDQIEDMVDRLPIHPPIWSRLRKAQKVMFLCGAINRRFAFHADTGVGKTMLSIALARYFTKLGEVKAFLVLVPNSINKAEWAREIRKHTKHLTCCVLEGSTKEKWEVLQKTDAHLYVDTYAGLLHMVCNLEVGDKDKKKMKPDPKRIRALLKRVHGLILDESTKIKNHRKLPYRLCRKISRSTKHVFTLTGTPFGREPLDLWAQMYVVDHGKTLGQTLGLFRDAFFEQEENFWGGIIYKFKDDLMPKLHKMLGNCAIRYKAEAADLPKVTRIKQMLELPTSIQTYYASAKQEMIKAKGSYTEMKNVFTRMRQMSSGFLGYHDDELGAKAEFEFPDQPKLDMIMSILESLPEDKKVIVFHDFIHSGDMIEKRLKEAKIGYLRLRTVGKKKEKPADLLHAFDHDPKKRVFILSTAGGYGLNLQVAKYAIFYEPPVSVIMRKQMERRLERQGSTHDVVFIYDLIVKDTSDERILEFYREGRKRFDAIVEGQTVAKEEKSLRQFIMSLHTQ